MEVFKHLAMVSAALPVVFSLLVLVNVHAQDQSGFISLDCGMPIDSQNYTEPTIKIKYISDAHFIDTGSSMSILPEYKPSRQQQLAYVRSFPQGMRNCYTVNVTRATKYLIRAFFFYGNYDRQSKLPEFELHLGPNFWDTVSFTSVTTPTFMEIIHVASKNYLQVCLVNIGYGTPFISSLDFRPLKNTTYVTPAGSLSLLYRLDTGSTTNLTYRFPYDVFDRLWWSYDVFAQESTSLVVDQNANNFFQPPSLVMRTAATPFNASGPLEINLGTVSDDYASTPYYAYMHFAELQQLRTNESRAFNITFNGKMWYPSMVPQYLRSDTVYSTTALTGSSLSFSLVPLHNSTLPPILNAIEIYTLLEFSLTETDQDDVDAITSIKSRYRVTRNWQGDPCEPVEYAWAGLNCSYEGLDPPRIISLNLSSSGLTGEIATGISGLTMLQSLDLSNNSLTGSVPDFLARLSNLKELNLKGNQLTGSIPTGLIEISESDLLTLSVEENQDLCASFSCKKKNNILIPILSSIGALVLLLLVVGAIFVFLKREKKQKIRLGSGSSFQTDSFEPQKRKFTYSEVLKITNNFEIILGKGGFGSVYHGLIDGTTEVAVKMLSPSSDGSENVLSWAGRLQIAIDTAHGLEYLHNGCKPPIVHRDVKTSNIFLTGKFQAKLADFGLSRIFPTDSGTHVSTIVARTPGYLDPENVVDQRLNGDFEMNSVWKAVETAMACVALESTRRPTMDEVVIELKDCLVMELARTQRNNNNSPPSIVSLVDSTEASISLNEDTHFSPLARKSTKSAI
ncbi:hypothetical protein FNV43_RR06746 [Rhamnella rubrinervis]|uniref:Protein kinase domain-containing protein n=1 Tax=Rhamnella rubrinervis TaxID=2594499 RepID=A0A8K0HDM1_9ROSA|nr:hypothetical protein FNV43_RR06746 [Rhamnella rubrinervis]